MRSVLAQERTICNCHCQATPLLSRRDGILLRRYSVLDMHTYSVIHAALQITYHFGHRCTAVDFSSHGANFLHERSSPADHIASSALFIKKSPPADLLIGALAHGLRRWHAVTDHKQGSSELSMASSALPTRKSA